MGRITIFVDESGTLPDPKDTVIVIAAVGTANPAKFETIIKQVQKKKKLRKQTGELKFYTSGEKTKRLVLKSVAKETGKNNQFYKLIKKQIISEKRIKWAEAKRRIFAENKNLLEPV